MSTAVARPPIRDAGARRRLAWKRFSTHVLPVLISLSFLLPILFVFFWMISMSLKTQVEISGYPPTFWPNAPTFQWYEQLLQRTPFLRNTGHSLMVGIASTGLGLLLGLPAAYAISRWKMTRVATIFLVSTIIPAISYLIPWYIVAKRTGLDDTLLVLIVVHLVITLPFIIWMMIGFFDGIPRELEDSATVDGCSIFQSFVLVALPLVRPGIAAAMLLAFIWSWNNFLFAAILSGPNSQTLPVVVYGLLSFEEANWGPLAAAAALMSVPVVAIALFFQRFLVEGLTAGAVKG